MRSSQATSPADNGNVNAGSNSNTNALNDTSNSGTVAVPGTNAVRQNDNPALRAEVLRIFANDLRSGPLSSDDKQYLSQQVAQVTGLSRAEADRRVDDVYARLSKVKSDTEVAAKDTADKARKIAAQSALWIFVALLVGAFFASITATLGGKQRDRVL